MHIVPVLLKHAIVVTNKDYNVPPALIFKDKNNTTVCKGRGMQGHDSEAQIVV